MKPRVLQIPNPVLRKESKFVDLESLKSKEIKAVIEKIRRTMKEIKTIIIS